MKVDIVSSEKHYTDHMRPIFDALPEELRGREHPMFSTVEPPDPGDIALVAGWKDVQTLRGRCKMIYVEHGAGQTYAGDFKRGAHLAGYSSSGGERHVGVIGFIAPNEDVAKRWKTAPARAVGCPKMDRWFDHGKPRGPAETGSVCFAWHWDENALVPEMRSAWDHYAAAMPNIVAAWKFQDWAVYGHAHPRWHGQLDERLRACGMEVLATDADVFDRVGMLLVDNSSLAYEFALLDRPVVSLNAPWYRRDVEHGLRFWESIPGPSVDDPIILQHTHLRRLYEADADKKRRRQVVRRVYRYRDGDSAERAADFIVSLLGTV